MQCSLQTSLYSANASGSGKCRDRTLQYWWRCQKADAYLLQYEYECVRQQRHPLAFSCTVFRIYMKGNLFTAQTAEKSHYPYLCKQNWRMFVYVTVPTTPTVSWHQANSNINGSMPRISHCSSSSSASSTVIENVASMYRFLHCNTDDLDTYRIENPNVLKRPHYQALAQLPVGVEYLVDVHALC